MRLEDIIEREYQSAAPQERYVPDFIENHQGDEEEIKALYDYIDRSEKSMFEQGFKRGIEEGKRQCGVGKTLATEIIREGGNWKRFWFAMFIIAMVIMTFGKVYHKKKTI